MALYSMSNLLSFNVFSISSNDKSSLDKFSTSIPKNSSHNNPTMKTSSLCAPYYLWTYLIQLFPEFGNMGLNPPNFNSLLTNIIFFKKILPWYSYWSFLMSSIKRQIFLRKLVMWLLSILDTSILSDSPYSYKTTNS